MWGLLWLLPALIAATAAAAHVPCASLLHAAATLAAVSAVWQVAGALLPDAVWHHADRGVRVRGLKCVHHAGLAAAAALAAVAEWDAAARAVYGYAFWTWVLAACVDPFLHPSQSSEYAVYALHHSFTLLLIALSSHIGYELQGAVVMACFEATDVAYSALKLARVAGATEPRQRALFGVFALSWVAFRWVVLPWRALLPATLEAWRGEARDARAHAAAVAVLWVLQALNAAWTYKIQQVARAVAGGARVDAAGKQALRTDRVV